METPRLLALPGEKTALISNYYRLKDVEWNWDEECSRDLTNTKLCGGCIFNFFLYLPPFFSIFCFKNPCNEDYALEYGNLLFCGIGGMFSLANLTCHTYYRHRLNRKTYNEDNEISKNQNRHQNCVSQTTSWLALGSLILNVSLAIIPFFTCDKN